MFPIVCVFYLIFGVGSLTFGIKARKLGVVMQLMAQRQIEERVEETEKEIFGMKEILMEMKKHRRNIIVPFYINGDPCWLQQPTFLKMTKRKPSYTLPINHYLKPFLSSSMWALLCTILFSNHSSSLILGVFTFLLFLIYV